jgi:acyl-CoA synthetase (AMP-forming)/AMP-acid ligase II
VVALVELAESGESLSLEDLQAHCRTHLAGYKIPRGIVLCEIQRTPTGKVDYVWAKQRAIEGS